jgi:hypothetical protein
MAPSLDTLTEELLSRIISFVTPHSSLHSLALVSRTLNRFATSYLYASVDFKGAYPDTGVKYLIPFAFLAFQRPEIASLVRSFSIRDTFGLADDLIRLEDLDDDNEDARRGWPDHPHRDQILQSAIEGIGYTGEEVDEWLATLLEADDESAILAILLPHLKKLRRLDLGHSGSGIGDPLLSTIHRLSQRDNSVDGPGHFSALTDVFIVGYEDKYPCSPTSLGACLYLPSLRRLHSMNLGENDQDTATEELVGLPKGCSSVEEIELRASKLYSEDLKLLLNAPKALKTFIYEVGQSWAWYPLDTRDIADALSCQEEHLSNLVLDHPYFLEETEVDSLAPMDFSAFKKLDFLKVSGLFLGGTHQRDTCSVLQSFPRSLKRLYVTYCSDSYHCAEIMPALLEVLQLKEEYLPNLETLTLEGPFNLHPEALESAKDIARCVITQGVRAKVIDAYRKEFGETYQKGWGLDEEVGWQEIQFDNVEMRELVEIEVQ